MLQPGCWYLSHFLFGDTHYNSSGDAVVADAIGKSLVQTPVKKLTSAGAPGLAGFETRVRTF